MQIDPGKLKPADVVRLLNSAGLGPVIDDSRLYRHRQRAGFRISPDGRTVNFYKYLAWLVDERHGPRPEQSTRDYEAMKEAARARNASLSAAGRDIGAMPEVVDPARRDACEKDFRAFCEAYFPETFYAEWSEDHLRVIARIEQVVLHGGLFALAMPRGSGKSSLAECACLWAILYGHRNFVCLIGASEDHATEMLEERLVQIGWLWHFVLIAASAIFGCPICGD